MLRVVDVELFFVEAACYAISRDTPSAVTIKLLRLAVGGRHKDTGGVTRGKDLRETQRLNQRSAYTWSSFPHMMTDADEEVTSGEYRGVPQFHHAPPCLRYHHCHSLEYLLPHHRARCCYQHQLYCCMLDQTRHWETKMLHGASLA